MSQELVAAYSPVLMSFIKLIIALVFIYFYRGKISTGITITTSNGKEVTIELSNLIIIIAGILFLFT